MDYKLRTIGKQDISIIKSLWEKLNQIHLHDSRYFKEHFKTFTFEERCEKFSRLDDHDILIEVVDNKESKIIGYCISTIENKTGEIDSLFVEEAYRKNGIGEKLIEHGIQWLKEKKPTKIVLAVADGHESVFNFYKKCGFYPRMTYLQLKDTTVSQEVAPR